MSTAPFTLTFRAASKDWIMPNHIQQLLEQLGSDSAYIHEPAARELVRSGAMAAVPLSRVCNTPSALSHRAAAVLMKIGRDAVEPLVQVLQTGNCEAQVHAIVALHLIKEPSSMQPLIMSLESPYAEVRKVATQALWMLRDPKAVEPLIRHLEDDDIEVAASAASTLGWIGDRQAVVPLLAALENRNWQLRAAAAHALGDIGDECALEPIRSHLFDSKKSVRKAVKGVLSRFHFRKQDQQTG